MSSAASGVIEKPCTSTRTAARLPMVPARTALTVSTMALTCSPLRIVAVCASASRTGRSGMLYVPARLSTSTDSPIADAACDHRPIDSPAILCVEASAAVSAGGVGSHTGTGAMSASPNW
jgi:hypothetical protein